MTTHSVHPVEPERLPLPQTVPDLYRAYLNLEAAVQGAGLDATLYELIKTRASQINGCAYCLDMHTKDARAGGETEQRLYGLPVWRELSIYTDRERAALALTEAVTLVSQSRVPADVWDAAARVFSPQELGTVLMAIVTINGWNRMAIATRQEAGNYVPGQYA